MASPAGRVAGTRADPAAELESPQFIESAGRPLYCVYHAPRRPRHGAPVVVQCHSLGIEQITNYRNEVLTARAAAEAGIPTLRYHARGHGDSAGDFAGVTLDSLVEDAVAAADHARRLSDAARVVWLGARFGALVAAHALARRGDTAGIVLWEPVENAFDYFRAMLRNILLSQVVAGHRPDASVEDMLAALEREGRVDVHGYYLHRPVLESARGRGLAAALSEWNGPTLLVQIQDRRGIAPVHQALADGLEARGARVRLERIPEQPGWHFASNPAWRSPALVDLTVEWLDALE